MSALQYNGLTPMQIGRLDKELDEKRRFEDGSIQTLRAWLSTQERVIKSEDDGMIDYNRRHFNRLDYREQKEYMDRLKAKRHYWINGIKVSKTVYSAIVATAQCGSEVG